MIVADDFGESKDVDLAILNLVQCIDVGYVSAFSRMKYSITSDELLKNINTIRSLNPNIKFGLHYEINFLKGRISLKNQFVEFESTYGFPPDYIDGHLHIHSIPIVDLLINKFIRRRNILIRCTKLFKNNELKLSLSSRYKKMLFSLFHRNIKNLNYMNDSICNIYDLNNSQDFKLLWNYYNELTEIEKKNTLFIIHPSIEKSSWKYGEYKTLLENKKGP